MNFFSGFEEKAGLTELVRLERMAPRLLWQSGKGGYEFAMELRAVSTGGRILTQGGMSEGRRGRGSGAVVLPLRDSAITTVYQKGSVCRRIYRKLVGNTVGLDEELTGSARTEFLYQMAMQTLLAENGSAYRRRRCFILYDTHKAEHVADHKSLYDRFCV